MKLAKLQIENFRHLGSREKPFELDFTDALGRVREFTLLVGPNTCGKTTILDAIAAALGPSLGMPTLRPGFRLSPRTVVRRGALNAKVTCWLRFSSEEIAATRDIFRIAEIDQKVPEASEAKLSWTYPDPRPPSRFTSLGAITTTTFNPNQIIYNTNVSGRVLSSGNPLIFPALSYYATSPENGPPLETGFSEHQPEDAWSLFLGRFPVAQLLSTGRADWSWFHKVGGVFTFDQERTGLGKTISRQVWNIIHGSAQAARENEELRTTDPRTILIEMALQSLVPSTASKGRISEDFRLIQERYARICAPRRIDGAVRDELGEFDVRFNDGENEYTYEGLSSGEKNVLLLLIRFVAERMHQSIVLIDELELNQHPLWQDKLVYLIPRMGDGNQIIATTHSPYLRGAVPPDAVIDLGDLGEVHAAGAS